MKDKKQYLEDVSILSEGIELEGKIKTAGNIRIDGKVIGDVTAAGNVTLGDKGEIKGNLSAKTATLGGKIEGTVQTTERLILEAKSNVIGDIETRILVIEEGAVFNGHSKMSI